MNFLNEKTILITGGTGSFGQKFVQTLLENYNFKKIIIYSRDELKQHEMQNSEPYYSHNNKLRFFIGDVRDLTRLKFAMEDVDYVVHAAALKQVPACEYNPFEAVKTNVLGAQNVIDASIASKVKKVVALSTDKACAPINIYGATKLTSDKLFIAANNYKGKHDIKFSVVRYGNVMGSRGSVIPFFQKMKKTGTIPITDKKMTRFNITLQEGVNLVILAFKEMFGGELFVLKIPSYHILDLSKAVAPECKVKIIGIRPGEKIHEEMITITDAINTIEMESYYAILPTSEENKILNNWIAKGGKVCEYGFNYSSGNNKQFLTVEELRQLIETI
ncbi:MAG: UDP-N-acetylglucosamine 4,6-dehydratase (inverting) [bacterium]|nr:UDP-N-acetylglucosamine 4,6-dehydratase (inverting) [bacterium]